jgi:amino acid transporter
MGLDRNQKAFLKRFIPIAAVIGGLCCLTPVILVLFGLSTVAFAASLSDTLYFGYAWWFRGFALMFLLLGLGGYFYKKEKVCSIDEFKKKRKRIINFVLLAVIIATLSYIIWLYVIVELIGIGLGIWG